MLSYLVLFLDCQIAKAILSVRANINFLGLELILLDFIVRMYCYGVNLILAKLL